MPKLVGLVGVSGSGKTTLGQALEDKDVAFVKTTVSEIYKRLGKDPKVAMTIDERLEVQGVILKELHWQWCEALANNQSKKFVVTDRTPYCFIAYMLAEVSGYGELTESQNRRVASYVLECQAVALMFSDVVHLPISHLHWQRQEEGKVCATTGLAYNLHYDSIIRGLMTGFECNGHHVTEYDLNRRIDQVRKFLSIEA
jgi:predicted ATPase